MKATMTLLMLCISVALTAQQTSNFTNSQSTWYAQATAAISKMQYGFKALDGNNKFASVNPANKFAFETSAKKFSVRKIDNTAEVVVSFSLTQINGKPFTENAHSLQLHESNTLNYYFNNVQVQYINNENGLRQNFIINSKTGSDVLSVSLHVNSPYKKVLRDGTGLALVKDGKKVFSYDDLRVWDANGKILPAHMQLHNDVLNIVVDAKDAAYPVTIDPLNHNPNWQDSGNGLIFPLLNDLTAQVMYGFSVSDAGDVNNDGFGDIIVGAPAYVDILSISGGTFNTVSVGAAFLYYGSGSGPSVDPVEVMQPTSTAGALFGFSVSKAGDINGDGYGDVVVGAPGDRITLNVGVIPVATSVATGKVYIYYGGPAGTFDGNKNTEPTVSATLNLTQSDFGSLLAVPISPLYGFSVSEAGDVNGDGYGDVAVGTPAYLRLLPVPLRTGRVDVYHGSSSGIASTPATKITGTTLNELFGFSVSTAGNVNGDLRSGRPVSDIVVGAPADLSVLLGGKAYIFHGSTTGVTATSTTGANTTLSNGSLLSTLFGYSVSNAGDVNNDGYADVVIGEPAALESLLSQTAAIGAAHIFYGSASGTRSTGSVKLKSSRSPSVLGLLNGNLLFGFSVSGAGDVNCDGYADVIVGEPGGTALSLGSGLLGLVSANVLSGQAYVYYGSATGPQPLPSYWVNETNTVSVANLIGYSVSGAGDLNGDGKLDMLVGAPNGTMNLSGSLIPAVGSAIQILNVNSVGSSYAYFGCLPTQSVLPVTLTSFTAQKDAAGVSVNWSASREVNLNSYEVMWSANGTDFKTVSTVAASQNRNYNFIHRNPAKVNYYRLKMIDKDGSFSYSTVAMVRFEDAGNIQLTMSPNPSRGQFNINMDGLSAGKYQIKIRNAIGQEVYSKVLTVSQSGFAANKVNSMLSRGSYFVQVYDNTGDHVKSGQVIIQ